MTEPLRIELPVLASAGVVGPPVRRAVAMIEAMILPERPFLGCPVVGDLPALDADVAVMGIQHAVAYVVDEEQRGLATAPAAVREASQQFAEDLTHHDIWTSATRSAESALDDRALRAG
jgi:hypothetical protein